MTYPREGTSGHDEVTNWEDHEPEYCGSPSPSLTPEQAAECQEMARALLRELLPQLHARGDHRFDAAYELAASEGGTR